MNEIFPSHLLILLPSHLLRLNHGEPAGTRTQDTRLKRAVLYQLSYRPIDLDGRGVYYQRYARSVNRKPGRRGDQGPGTGVREFKSKAPLCIPGACPRMLESGGKMKLIAYFRSS